MHVGVENGGFSDVDEARTSASTFVGSISLSGVPGQPLVLVAGRTYPSNAERRWSLGGRIRCAEHASELRKRSGENETPLGEVFSAVGLPARLTISWCQVRREVKSEVPGPTKPRQFEIC